MSSSAKGLVLVVAEEVHEGLSRLAADSAVAVLQVASPAQALREVHDLRPALVAIQVSRAAREMCEMIRLLAEQHESMIVVAVATDHSPALERAMRRAGVTWYVPAASRELPELLAVGLGHRPAARGAARHRGRGARASGDQPARQRLRQGHFIAFGKDGV